ncbi:RNA polymerase sigma factor SigF [Streptomyces sp. NRRL F-5123]|uniref:RNA polymerase sigma factor SigF n=1 Tax=Streptomyces sp. NRRL F-5123 TaxID=1463856 RepID=UPI000AA4A7AA|nr:RNA polymerase sigma factor SigF [Streptomyces sp. NRRL F-5123]
MSAELSRDENPGTPAERDVPAARGRAALPAQAPDRAAPAGQRRRTAGEGARPHPVDHADDNDVDEDAAEQATTMDQEHAHDPQEREQGQDQGRNQGQDQDRGQSQSQGRDREHDPQDRSGARALFVELHKLPEGSPERAELRNQLVRMHLPLVEHLARRFRNRGEPLDDLTQVATIGLIKSVDRFDVDRGVEFSTYATPTVVGEIKRHFRDKGWAVRVPRRLQELRLALTTATGELSQRHGRAPTVHELAEHLKISEEEVLEGLESANAYSTLSLDVPDTDDESPAVADTLGSEDEALEGVEYRESLKPLLEQLPPREKTILLLRFFGNMTQSQIAQEVGISQMHVSRLLARTLAQLRDKLLIDE